MGGSDRHGVRARGDSGHGWVDTSALRHYSLAVLIAVECGVFALGAALIRISMRDSLGPAARGLLLGVAAGVLFAVSDIALKYLTGALHGGLRGIVSEWTLAAIAASVVAFYASGRGLQLGSGVAVIAFTSVCRQPRRDHGRHSRVPRPIGIGPLAIVGRVIALLPRNRRRGVDARPTASPWGAAALAELLARFTCDPSAEAAQAFPTSPARTRDDATGAALSAILRSPLSTRCGIRL